MSSDWSLDVFEKLSRPFDASDVQIKVQAVSKDKKKGQVVAYVDARVVIDRLDEVVGPWNWKDEYEVLVSEEGESGRVVEVKCRLTVLGVTKEDVGEGDSMKAAFSDALKRAAVKFGVGRYLYRLPKLWADLDDYGRIKDIEAVRARILGDGAAPTKDEPKDSGPKPAERKGPTEAQISLIRKLARKQGVKEDSEILELASAHLSREVTSWSDISLKEASTFIDYLRNAEEAGEVF